jgi:hypothetical protein
MDNLIKQIKPGGKVDLESSYVWFKNNCPFNGPLYDDFRIANIDSDTTSFVIQIEHQQNESRYAIFAKLNNFSEIVFKSNSISELLKWINKE